MADNRFTDEIAVTLNLSPRQVNAVIQLFEEGCTIPFIARYRKEAHGNLDEVQIASIQLSRHSTLHPPKAQAYL